jgi:glutaminyl-tRNA synthetase
MSEAGSRKVPFSKVLFIEKEDFMENPPNKFFRLSPGNEVRLRYAYFVKCTDVIKNEITGEITEIHCTYDPASKGGNSPDCRKVKGTIHWVSAANAVKAEVRLYDRLFVSEFPEQVEEGQDYKNNLNPESLKIITAYVEPSLANPDFNTKYQFERLGYFSTDKETLPNKPVFNRTVTLKDSWGGKKQ